MISAGVVLSRIAAAAIVVAAVGASALLFAPWHEVRHASAAGMAGAFYFGPDYRVSAEDRARMLEPTEHYVCSGVTHFDQGMLPVAALLSLAAFAGVSGAVTRARRHLMIAVAALVLAALAFYMVFSATFLRHLFEKVGTSTRFETAFGYALNVVFWSLLVVCVAHLALAWLRRDARSAQVGS